MEIRSFDDWRRSVRETRRVFDEATKENDQLLRDTFGLFVESVELVRADIRSEDDVVLPLELLCAGTNRVLSSYILLENGRFTEARSILRNALELMLIAIEVIHDDNSRELWMATKETDASSTPHSEFRARHILRRIRSEEQSFPPLEAEFAEHIYSQWEYISSTSSHTLFYSQLKSDITPDGKCSLAGWLLRDEYQRFFRQYSLFFFNAVSILLGVPALRWVLNGTSDRNPVIEFRRHFHNMKETLFWSNIRTKAELLAALREQGVSIDVSSVPENAVIDQVELDLSDPKNPKMTLVYADTSES